MGKNKKKRSGDDFIMPLSPSVKVQNTGGNDQEVRNSSKPEIQAFIKWCDDNGFELNKKLRVTAESCAGHGVVTAENMEKRERLFKVPRSALLLWENSSIKDKLANLKTKEPKGLAQVGDSEEEEDEEEDDDDDEREDDAASPWTRLILAIMHELAKNGKSHWQPYLDILPRNDDHPLLWTVEEAKELQDTVCRRLVESNISMAKEEFDRFASAFIKEHADSFGGITDALSTFLLVTTWVMAYSFSDNTNGVMMVPMADMLNHVTGKNNARLFFEKGNIEMNAVRAVEKGGELFNTYGDLAGPMIFSKYGFVEAHNPNDYVEVDMELVRSVACAAAVVLGREEGLVRRHRDLRREDMIDDEDGCFVVGIEDGKAAFDLLDKCVHVYCMTTEEYEKFAKKYDFVQSEGDDNCEDENGNTYTLERLLTPSNGKGRVELSEKEKEILLTKDSRRPHRRVLGIIMERKWQSYATSLGEDKLLLKTEAEGRRRTAIEMRVLEKEYLQKIEKLMFSK